jgi:hypothetical protein
MDREWSHLNIKVLSKFAYELPEKNLERFNFSDFAVSPVSGARGPSH